MGPSLADCSPDGSALVAAEIVHDHDVAGVQSGHQRILDVGAEHNTVDRPVEEDGSCDAVLSKCCQEGQGLPFAKGRLGEKPLTASTAPTARCHVSLSPGSSRPEELHPRPLTERCVNLSIHTALIK